MLMGSAPRLMGKLCVVGIEHAPALTMLAESNIRADGLGAALLCRRHRVRARTDHACRVEHPC